MSRGLLGGVAAALLTALLAAATAGRAHATPQRCHLRAGERVVAHSPEAIVFGSADAVSVCVRRSGKRRELWHSFESYAGEDSGYIVRGLVGTRVLAVDWYRNSYTGRRSLLVLDNAARRSRVTLMESDSDVAVARMGRDGTVVWISGGPYAAPSLWLRTSAGAQRLLGRGESLTSLRLSAEVVRWSSAEMDHAVPVAPPDRCPATLASGSQEIGILSTPTETTLCDRATGRRVVVPAATVEATAGVHAALRNGAGIVLVNVRAAIVETIPVSALNEVVVNESGDLAWAIRDWSATPIPPAQLWVRDAAGARQVAEAPVLDDLVLEQQTLSWREDGPDTATRRHLTLEP